MPEEPRNLRDQRSALPPSSLESPWITINMAALSVLHLQNEPVSDLDETQVSRSSAYRTQVNDMQVAEWYPKVIGHIPSDFTTDPQPPLDPFFARIEGSLWV